LQGAGKNENHASSEADRRLVQTAPEPRNRLRNRVRKKNKDLDELKAADVNAAHLANEAERESRTAVAENAATQFAL
jgi:hypothetical protein